MKEQTIGSIARMAGAALSAPEKAAQPIRGVSFDTRTLEPNEIYIPLIGEKLDGHQFIDMAFRKGAAATFCDTQHEVTGADRIVLRVNDTMQALHTLAANYRASLPCKVVGITGSNGKTTTKDIIKSILEQKYRTRKTIGNLNNQIGVPRTLLDLDEDTEIGVVEMGMDHFGEISELVRMSQPDVSVITNVGDVHLEQLKTRENVAKAKLEILEQMDENGVFLYNYDNDTLRNAVAARTIRPRVITFGTQSGAEHVIHPVRSNALGTTFTLDGEEWTVNLLGNYQSYNATVGILVGRLFGLSTEQIRAGLQVEDPTAMRSELISANGFDILNDSYKSNPQSLLEALDTLRLLRGYRQKMAIIGDMLELGDRERNLHYEIGQKLDPAVLDYVLLYGPLSEEIYRGALEHFPADRVFHFDSKPDLVDRAKTIIARGTLVLVKASRALRMEEVVESLKTITR